jgi:hypothetical protein
MPKRGSVALMADDVRLDPNTGKRWRWITERGAFAVIEHEALGENDGSAAQGTFYAHWTLWARVSDG